MPYIILISLGITIVLFVISILFKVAGKLRLTIPLIYFLLTATFLNKWAAANEQIAFLILYALLALSVLSWLASLKKTLRERRYTKALKDDITWQIARARERDIPFESVYFDSNGNMRYKDTNEIVD